MGRRRKTTIKRKKLNFQISIQFTLLFFLWINKSPEKKVIKCLRKQLLSPYIFSQKPKYPVKDHHQTTADKENSHPYPASSCVGSYLGVGEKAWFHSGCGLCYCQTANVDKVLWAAEEVTSFYRILRIVSLRTRHEFRNYQVHFSFTEIQRWKINWLSWKHTKLVDCKARTRS